MKMGFAEMPLFGGGYSGPQAVSYLFVDMGCLRETIKPISTRYFGNPSSLRLDMTGLRGPHTKVFVYDAVPAQDHGEPHADWERRLNTRMEEVKRIRALNGFHMPLGDLRGKKASQKKVDVMITVDMLMHTIRRNMHTCTLLTGDSDFQPLLEALTREGMMTTLWCPDHAPEDLRGAADGIRRLGVAELWPALHRPDGLPLAAKYRNDVRNPNRGQSVARELSGNRMFELSRGREWTLERYDPNAYGTTEQISDTDPRIAVAYAEDMWQGAVPVSIKEAAGVAA